MPDCALTYAAVSLSWQASASDISRTARCSLKTNATTQSVNRISVAAMLRLHRTVGRTPSSALNHRLRSPTMRWTRGSSSEAVSLLPLRIVTPLEVAFRAQAVVATPAICMDHAARLDGVEHKCVEALGGGVRYLPQPDTPDALPILLGPTDVGEAQKVKGFRLPFSPLLPSFRGITPE